MDERALSSILSDLPRLSEDVIANFCGARNFEKVKNYIDDGVHGWRRLSSVYRLTFSAVVGSAATDSVQHTVTIDCDEMSFISADCTRCFHGYVIVARATRS